MSYRFKEMIEKFKKQLPVYFVLWVFLVIVIVSPVSCAVKIASVSGQFDMSIFFNQLRRIYQ